LKEKKSQRRFTAREKFNILREGENGSMNINEVCRRYGISTALYYQWRKQAQEAMLEGLNPKTRRNSKTQREIDLEADNERLKATLLEITQENVELKKKNLR
jgi:transposase-like protein